MKAFEEYERKAEIKTIGFLTFDAAFKHGRREGWRAALEQVERYWKDNVDGGPANGLYLLRKSIRKELEGDTCEY